MPLAQILTYGIIYALLLNGFLFAMMVTLSPRVWGYNDYPQHIKDRVPPQTNAERQQAYWMAAPFMLVALGYPIYATVALKNSLSGSISLLEAFLNLFVMFFLASLIDLIILDWLIISKITPGFVIMPGTEAADYKDLSPHYKAQVRAFLIITPILLIIAALFAYL